MTEAEYQKAYYNKHKERFKAYNKLRHHTLRQQTHRRGWCPFCPLCVFKQSATRYSHQPKNKERAKARYKYKPDIVKQWKNKNPDKILAYRIKSDHKRRARERDAPGQFSAEDFNTLCAKYGNRCLKCGRSNWDVFLTADHVILLSAGGSNWIDNIQPLCQPCNSSKGRQTTDYRKIQPREDDHDTSCNNDPSRKRS